MRQQVDAILRNLTQELEETFSGSLGVEEREIESRLVDELAVSRVR